MSAPPGLESRTPGGAYPEHPISDRPGTLLMQKYRSMPRQQLGRLIFLAAALIGFSLSIALWFTDHQMEGIYVGIWVPSILAFGAFWFITREEG